MIASRRAATAAGALSAATALSAGAASVEGGAAAISAASGDGDLQQRQWRRRGRRRLHVCAAGGPSKKLGAVSSPRGSEVWCHTAWLPSCVVQLDYA